MLSEKRLRRIFGAIGQQRDSDKVFLLREIDCVFEKLVAVALTLIPRVHHQIFQEHNEPAFGRADGEKQIDHPDDCAIAPQHKDPATAGLFENEPQPAELFVFIGTEVPLLSEQFVEAFPTTRPSRLPSPARSRHFLSPPYQCERYFRNAPCWQLRKLEPFP